MALYYDLPPFQPDTTYVDFYGEPGRVYAVVIYSNDSDWTTDDVDSNSPYAITPGVIRVIPYRPESWFDLRQMQRAQLSIYGTDFYPYSRGWLAGVEPQTQPKNPMKGGV